MGTPLKKGYSIWSLLVIMTLVAVWMAMPRIVWLDAWPDILFVLFIYFHQMVIWSLMASVIWIATGRRRFVKYLLSVMIAFLWFPMVIMLAEGCLFESRHAAYWLERSGLAGVYFDMIEYSFRLSGYAH